MEYFTSPGPAVAATPGSGYSSAVSQRGWTQSQNNCAAQPRLWLNVWSHLQLRQTRSERGTDTQAQVQRDQKLLLSDPRHKHNSEALTPTGKGGFLLFLQPSCALICMGTNANTACFMTMLFYLGRVRVFPLRVCSSFLSLWSFRSRGGGKKNTMFGFDRCFWWFSRSLWGVLSVRRSLFSE